MSPRAHGEHVRKMCGCGWRRWPKCPHPWYFSYKARGGERYRFSFDAEFGGHLESKGEAETKAMTIRAAIGAGTFERVADRRLREQREADARAACARTETAIAAPLAVTLDQFAAIYMERAVRASGKASWKDDQYLLGTVRAHRTADGRRLGEWALASITEDELEEFLAAQRTAGRAVSTLNHLVQITTASFRWAARKGYIGGSPVSDDFNLKRGKPAQRTRRLAADEETALLTAAGSLSRDAASLRLSGLIVAALETGCRQGELLALQWADVDLSRRELVIRAENAKDSDVRVLPISTRLAAVLDMVNTDSAGRADPPTAYVFGLFGEPVKSIDKGWETCVLRAHGHEPVWTTNGKLAEVSRLALRAIDLHFHDLRHEAGSRWLEAGMPLHHVKEMLGHANISQTDTYLNAGRVALKESMQRVDEVRRGNPVAKKPPIEHRPLSQEEPKDPPKGLLH